MGGVNKVDDEAMVRNALMDDRFDWRTPTGIASEVGLEVDRVLAILRTLEAELVSTNDPQGRQIFALRRRYRRTESFLNRTLTAIAGKVK